MTRVSDPFIRQHVPLHDKNWFKTGGPARFFCEPRTAQEFAQALSWAASQSLDIFVLGNGANVLISDDGFDGLVIAPTINHRAINPIDSAHSQVTAGAGILMHDLIEFCLAHQLLGLEEFSGIPGTVGGSVFINLHYFEFLISQFLIRARVIERSTGQIIEVDNAWFAFDYNHSTLHARDHYLIDATFQVRNADIAQVSYARGRRHEIIRHRERRYPISHTCGSFFRQFHAHETNLTINGKKMIFVGYYLDKIGVKGQLRIGDAQVSYQHANMIINCGNATSTDIILLARRMQELVFEQFDVLPQPECELIGFNTYPLHTHKDLVHNKSAFSSEAFVKTP